MSESKIKNKFNVLKYNVSYKDLWNSFIDKAKNSTFLFHRDFMDYHKDRFRDFSLLVFKANKLVAVLPANLVDNHLYSHQGLSYGGLIIKETLRFEDYLEIFKTVLSYLESQDILFLTLKPIPSIYTQSLSFELDYLIQFLNSETIKTDSYFVVDTTLKYQPNRNRKRAIDKAKQLNIKISNDGLHTFWDKILKKNLNDKYNVNPVHTFDEISRLKSNFPEHIKTYFAIKDENIEAGVVMFITKNVAHFQYSSGNEDKDDTGALDYLFDYIIKKHFNNYKYISFGSSSTDKSLKINRGLAYWKESFGARNIPQFTYEISTKSYKKLDNVFL